MSKFNFKEHNRKVFLFGKRAASGAYPSKKVATIGSFAGVAAGILLFAIGGIGVVIKNIWGLGSILAGAVLILSNAINLKRIK
jgi:hypothetical protein